MLCCLLPLCRLAGEAAEGLGTSLNNLLEDFSQVTLYILIPKPQHPYPALFQKSHPRFVPFRLGRHGMSPSVHFYRQLTLDAKQVKDELLDGVLAAELQPDQAAPA